MADVSLGSFSILTPEGAVSHRGWARVLDLFLWQIPLTVITYLALGLVLPWHMLWPDTAGELLLLAPAFIPVIALESTFLVATGTTPGKSLCHLRVHSRGEPSRHPTRQEAMRRTCVVQAALWAGVPFSFATHALLARLPFDLTLMNSPFVPLILVTLPAGRANWVALQDFASGLDVSREQKMPQPKGVRTSRDPFAPRRS